MAEDTEHDHGDEEHCTGSYTFYLTTSHLWVENLHPYLQEVVHCEMTFLYTQTWASW